MALNNNCIRVGYKAPNFCATGVYQQEFKQVKLTDYLGKYGMKKSPIKISLELL